ncbi:putative rRNA methylase YtqB [Eucalyptus grandis]|uniref:putative rRNA methylase YtqB n=1 Tax=Eucalyptus grandis TaxID=71139 RepID=UPI00192EBE80|nr:putative rRNA methylase YtqB [Eucalyptus grandis]
MSLRLPPPTSCRWMGYASSCVRRAKEAKRHFTCFSNPSSSLPNRNASISNGFPLPGGLEDQMVGYIFGRRRATDVAHSVWKHVVREGDTVVDATCGNGHDTLALVKLVAGESGRGRVYGMDIQEDALRSTSCFLGQSLSTQEMELVKLLPMCHSKLAEIDPDDASVRLVAFNLGYLPGGDKAITTKSETTRLALEAAGSIIEPGGLISTVVYVGHPNGREEFETVQAFASGLSTENWVCCKLQMLNRPLAPVLIFMFKR